MDSRNGVSNNYENRLTAIQQTVAYGKPALIAALVFAYCCIAAAQTKPVITGFLVDGVESNRAAVRATLTIQGTGFGATQGFSTATLGGIALAGAGVAAKWSNTSIVAVIPLTAVSGPVIVNVWEDGQNFSSNRKNLAVQVEITKVLPDSSRSGLR